MEKRLISFEELKSFLQGEHAEHCDYCTHLIKDTCIPINCKYWNQLERVESVKEDKPKIAIVGDPKSPEIAMLLRALEGRCVLFTRSPEETMEMLLKTNPVNFDIDEFNKQPDLPDHSFKAVQKRNQFFNKK